MNPKVIIEFFKAAKKDCEHECEKCELKTICYIAPTFWDFRTLGPQITKFIRKIKTKNCPV